MRLGISVIICCYNSSERLPETLKHIALQQVPAHIVWEVIVVDNASTDDTYEVASSEWKKYRVNNVDFKVVKQPVAGLMHARKMAFATAKYEYLLFCDDDNWLSENYLAVAFEILNADNKIGVLGGKGIALAEQPALVDDETIKQIAACGSQTWAQNEHWVYGAGAIYRKSILANLSNHHWQPITTGRKGTSLIAGEDVEICLIVYLSGYKIIADDRLVFRHFVPLKRQSVTYINNLEFWLSYTNVLLYSYFAIVNKETKPFENVIHNWMISAAKSAVRHRVLSILRSGAQNTVHKKAFRVQWGTLKSLFNNRSKIIGHHYHIKSILPEINHSRQQNNCKS